MALPAFMLWYAVGVGAFVVVGVFLYFLIKCCKDRRAGNDVVVAEPDTRRFSVSSYRTQSNQWHPSSFRGSDVESRRSRSESRGRAFRTSAQVTVQNERRAQPAVATVQPRKASTALPSVHGKRSGAGKENFPGVKTQCVAVVADVRRYPAKPKNYYSEEESSEEKDTLAAHLWNSIRGLIDTSALYTHDPAWITFKQRHVITLQQFPHHWQWNSQKWNKYLREQGISSRDVNSIISCTSEEEIFEDFNPLDESAQFVENNAKGPNYRSRNSHEIYHMIALAEGNNSGGFKVYRDTDMYFVAGVELMSSSGNGRAVWVPVHFHSRYLTEPVAVRYVRGSRLLK